jgi:hypothetical protein
MNAYETVFTISQILITLISFGNFIIALLSFSDRKRKH